MAHVGFYEKLNFCVSILLHFLTDSSSLSLSLSATVALLLPIVRQKISGKLVESPDTVNSGYGVKRTPL